jgi:hypothetical protein
MASKLARSDSSEWNRNNGGPSPDCAALTVAAASSRSIPVSLSHVLKRPFWRTEPPIARLKSA